MLDQAPSPRVSQLFPFLFATLPMLRLAVLNPGEFALADLLAATALALIGAAALLVAFRILTPPRFRSRFPPFATMAAITWFWGYSFLVRHLGADRMWGLAALGLVTAAGLYWVSARPRRSAAAAGFLTLFGGLLNLAAILNLTVLEVRAYRALDGNALVAQARRPLRLTSTGASLPWEVRPPPNVYLIVLDERAGPDYLRRYFDFDNTAFVDSLRGLGFSVPRVVLANHSHTMLSLPSLLNFMPLQGLADQVDPGTTDPRIPTFLVQHSRVTRFFRSHAYRVLFFPSQWYPPTRHLEGADAEWEAWQDWNPNRASSRSDFRRVLRRESPVGLGPTLFALDADYVRRSFDAIEATGGVEGPVFVFAHILSPHWPYVLDERCLPVERAASTVAAYLQQVECIDRLVLRLVNRLIQASAVPPVIILQGDHGTQFLRYSDEPTVEQVSVAQARERLLTFGAYLLPGPTPASVPDTLTLANVFRLVLNRYFGTGLPLLPDTLYLSREQAPYRFRRFTVPDLVDPEPLRHTGPRRLDSGNRADE